MFARRKWTIFRQREKLPQAEVISRERTSRSGSAIHVGFLSSDAFASSLGEGISIMRLTAWRNSNDHQEEIVRRSHQRCTLATTLANNRSTSGSMLAEL